MGSIVRLRILYRFGLHFFLAALLLLWALNNVTGYFRSAPPGLRGVFEDVFTGPQTNLEALGWALAIITMITMYIFGITLARLTMSYRHVTARFDIGITAFILLFIIAGAADAPLLSTLSLMFAFFIFSLPAVAMARYQQAGGRSALIHRYRSSGPVLIFTTFVLIAGSGIAFLFYPFLLQAAQAGHGALEQYGKPLGELLSRMILFVFSRRSRMEHTPTNGITGPDHSDGVAPGNGQTGFLENILLWSGAALAAAAALAALYFGLRYPVKWLLSGSGSAGIRNSFDPVTALLRPLQKIASVFLMMAARLKAAIRRRFRLLGEGDAAYLFRKLLVWGAKSGRPRLKTETPLEYSDTLKKLFPALGNEITFITENFNRDIYGSLPPGPEQHKKLYRAWRRLLHPAFWPTRLKNRLAGSDS